jgi:hypothetical protein
MGEVVPKLLQHLVPLFSDPAIRESTARQRSTANIPMIVPKFSLALAGPATQKSPGNPAFNVSETQSRILPKPVVTAVLVGAGAARLA